MSSRGAVILHNYRPWDYHGWILDTGPTFPHPARACLEPWQQQGRACAPCGDLTASGNSEIGNVLGLQENLPNVVKTFASGPSTLFPFIFLHCRGCFPLVVISQLRFFFPPVVAALFLWLLNSLLVPARRKSPTKLSPAQHKEIFPRNCVLVTPVGKGGLGAAPSSWVLNGRAERGDECC